MKKVYFCLLFIGLFVTTTLKAQYTFKPFYRGDTVLVDAIKCCSVSECNSLLQTAYAPQEVIAYGGIPHGATISFDGGKDFCYEVYIQLKDGIRVFKRFRYCREIKLFISI